MKFTTHASAESMKNVVLGNVFLKKGGNTKNDALKFMIKIIFVRNYVSNKYKAVEQGACRKKNEKISNGYTFLGIYGAIFIIKIVL